MNELRKILNRIAAQALPLAIDPRVCNCIKRCDYEDETCAYDCLIGQDLDDYSLYLKHCVMGTSNTEHCKCVKSCTRSSTTSEPARDCVKGCLRRFGVALGKVDFWITECNKL